MSANDPKATQTPDAERERPRYEPPRITKRRSVARVTLQFTGATATGGPSAQGLVTEGGAG